MSALADIRVGISGWVYPPWRGTFFPPGLSQKRELHYASRVFRTIEINGTFYGLQKPESFARWAEETPEDFMFTVKAPRVVTHIRRLKEAEEPIVHFLASGVLRLGPKLGPILWQLPPGLRFNPTVLEPFLQLLPHDTEAAAALAKRHNASFAGRAWTSTDTHRPVRHALEIRHESFRDPRLIELLRRYDVALVCADTSEWPSLMDLTSDFVYCRLHNADERYPTGYTEEQIDRWAERMIAWAGGASVQDGDFAAPSTHDGKKRDVFAYFEHTMKLQAPGNSQTLMRRLAEKTAGKASPSAAKE
jgi:uncharacterized protein YecE (DUF72 family)